MNWDKTVPTDFLGYPILDEYQETIVHSDGFHIFFTHLQKTFLNSYVPNKRADSISISNV